MRLWKPVLPTLLLAVVAAGCGRATTPRSIETPTPVEPACPTGPPQETPLHALPDGFVTASVFRCRTDIRDLPGKGKWRVSIAERADTPAPALVAELRKPSEPRTTEPCTMELVVPPYFLLVDAGGKAVQPMVPTDPCGKPRKEALAELDKLAYRTLSETPVNQVQSRESIETGCSDSWKDELALFDKQGAGRSQRDVPLLSDPIKVCVYDRISGGDLPVGQLSKSNTITGDGVKALSDAVRNAGSANTCSTPHTRFAVLFTAYVQSGWGTAELDGCHRLLGPRNELQQLDERTAALLAG